MSWLSTISSWAADNTMVASAKSGVSIGSGAYSELEPRMTKAPKNILVAYEQALYFVALGARRSLREGDGASSALLTHLAALEANAAIVEQEVNFLCSTFGVACPAGGSAGVLKEAIDAIEMSGLNADDRVQIVSILKGNRTAVQIRQAIPVIAAVGVGALLGTLWYRRRRGA